MGHVLIFILKILGYLLLGLLLLLLLIIFTLLFVPIRYKICIMKDANGAEAKAKVRYLPGCFRIFAGITKEGFYYRVKLFGWTLMGNDPLDLKKKEAKEKRKNQKKKPDPIRKKQELPPEQEEMSLLEQEERSVQMQDTKEEKPQSEPSQTENLSDKNVKSEQPNKKKRGSKRKKEKKKAFQKKKKEASEGILTKLRETKQTFVTEENKKLLNDLFGLAKEILGYLLPDHVKGYVFFGMEDPYYTGMLTGILSMLHPLYQDDFSVKPDFTQKRLECNICATGKIRLFFFVRMGIRVIRDKEMIKNIKQLKLAIGGQKDGR